MRAEKNVKQTYAASDTVLFNVIVDDVRIESLEIPASALIVPHVGSIYELDQVDSYHEDESLNGIHCRSITVDSVRITQRVIRHRKNGEVKTLVYQSVAVSGTYLN